MLDAVPALKPDHITILFTDREASEAHYDRLLPLLGFRKLKRGIWQNDAGFHFQLLPAKEGTRPYERYGAGANHFGFGVPTADFVHDLHRALEEQGGDPPAIQNIGDATALFLKDPDGFRIEVTHYPPGVPVVD